MYGMTRAALLLALLGAYAAAQAGVYRCTENGKTVYSDIPCPSAVVVDTTNGRTPTREDQLRAQARALREAAAVHEHERAAAVESRERAECRAMARTHDSAVADANRYPKDVWWRNRAENSAQTLSARCGKYLLPGGAGHAP